MTYSRNTKRIFLVSVLIVITMTSIIASLFQFAVGVKNNDEFAVGWGRGHLTCPDGRMTDNVQISFQSTENKDANRDLDQSKGKWTIELLNTPTPELSQQSGSLYEAHVFKFHKFLFTGSELKDTLCKTNNNSIVGSTIDITIAGKCGKDVQIIFSSLNGEKGSFIGSTLCNLVAAES
jgi:hypothetical protein